MFKSRRFLFAVLSVALAPSALALVPIASHARLATLGGPAAKIEAMTGSRSAAGTASSEPSSTRRARAAAKRAKRPHKFRWPAHGWITSGFGWRPGRGFHHGLDIACHYNTPIIASHSGRVIYRGRTPWYGKAVVIGKLSGWNELYGHMRNYWVKAGDRVKQGEIIGTCGSTGNSTGYHVHFEIRKGGHWYDPATLLP